MRKLRPSAHSILCHLSYKKVTCQLLVENSNRLFRGFVVEQLIDSCQDI